MQYVKPTSNNKATSSCVSLARMSLTAQSRQSTRHVTSSVVAFNPASRLSLQSSLLSLLLALVRLDEEYRSRDNIDGIRTIYYMCYNLNPILYSINQC